MLKKTEKVRAASRIVGRPSVRQQNCMLTSRIIMIRRFSYHNDRLQGGVRLAIFSIITRDNLPNF